MYQKTTTNTHKPDVIETQNKESTKTEELKSPKDIPYFAIVIDQLFLC